jgi:hypothetical protein
MGIYLGSIPVGFTISMLDPASEFQIWKTLDMTNASMLGGAVPSDSDYEEAYVAYKNLVEIILGGLNG